MTLVTEDSKAQAFTVPCTSPCNTPMSPVKKPNGRGWRFVQNLRAINNAVLPRHLVVPNPHTLLVPIPAGSKFFRVTDLCSAFFCAPVEEAGLLPLLSLRRENNSPGH